MLELRQTGLFWGMLDIKGKQGTGLLTFLVPRIFGAVAVANHYPVVDLVTVTVDQIRPASPCLSSSQVWLIRVRSSKETHFLHTRHFLLFLSVLHAKMRSKFKDEHTFEKRKAEAERIRQKYTDRIPVQPLPPFLSGKSTSD